MVVSCISLPIKDELGRFFDRRAKDWINLSKLNKLINLKIDKPNIPKSSLPPDVRDAIMEKWRNTEKPSKKELEEEFVEFCLSKATDYMYLKEEFYKVPSCHGEKPSDSGTIRCLDSPTKSDICSYLNSYARRTEGKLSLEATILADTLRNNIPQCTSRGNISPAWLKKRGISRDDLVIVGNMMQISTPTHTTSKRRQQAITKYIVEWKQPTTTEEQEYDVEYAAEDEEK